MDAPARGVKGRLHDRRTVCTHRGNDAFQFDAGAAGRLATAPRWLMTALFFVAGAAFLITGAELLVRGSSRLAVAFGISPLVVGLTVVAFGTGAP